MKKRCSKCKNEKQHDEFNVDKSRKDGYSYRCKDCLRDVSQNYYSKKENKEKIKINSKKYYSEHKKEQILKNKEYVDLNRVKYRIYQNKYFIKNKEKVLEYKRKYLTHRYNTDPEFKLRTLFRSRFYSIVRNKHKIHSVIKMLGCTISECRKYLESKFIQGMSWENHGTLWEIDHILPCSNFDLTQYSEQCKCFHYTNLQPLLKNENRIKSNKI